MTIELATAYVNLVSSAKGMGKDIESQLGAAGDAGGEVAGENAGRSMTSRLGGFLKKSLVGVGVTAGVALGGVLVKGFGDAFSQSDATTKFKQSLDFAGITKAQIDQATKITQKYADDTVFDLSTVQNTAAQLAANGVKNFTGLTMAAGNLNAVAGGNADTFRGVAMALTQTVGAGKLTTENWNQIADAIPGASGVLQAALKKNGAFTGDFRDAMAKGQITAKEFNKALLKVGNRPIAVKAATSTATFEGAIGNLMATITGGFAKFLNSVKPQLTAVIGVISTGFSKGFAVVKSVFGFISDHSTIFGTLAVVVGAVAAAWVLWTGAVKAWQLATKIATAVQAAFNTVMNANPVLLVVAAIAALAAGFAYLWTHSQGFRDFWIGLWKKIKGVVSAVVGWFKDLPATLGRIFTAVIGWFKDLPGRIWGGVKSGASWLTTKARAIMTWIWSGIKGAAGAVWSWFTGLPSHIWDVIKGLGARLGTSGAKVISFIWSGIKSGAAAVWGWFGGIGDRIWHQIKAVGSDIRGFGGKIIGWVWSGIKSGASQIWEWFKALPTNIANAASSIWSTITGFGESVINHIGTGIRNVAGTIGSAVSGAVKAALNAAIWVVNKIIDGFNTATHGLSHVWSWAGIPAIPGIPHIPTLAKGGMLQEGFNIVNEVGPELLLKRGLNVRVIPAQQSARMMAQQPARQQPQRSQPAGPLIGQVNITDRMSPSQLANELDRQVAFKARV